MSLTLPLPIPQRSTGRTGTISATVLKFGCGTPPMTCEVVTEHGEQLTIWFRGYRLGEAVTLEQRMSASGPYWADIHDAGGPTSARATR